MGLIFQNTRPVLKESDLGRVGAMCAEREKGFTASSACKIPGILSWGLLHVLGAYRLSLLSKHRANKLCALMRCLYHRRDR